MAGRADPARSGLIAQARRGSAAASVLTAALIAAHAVRSRGRGPAARFAALGLTLPALAELWGSHAAHVVRHHTRPQVAGLPLGVVLGWYNIGYATLAVSERLVAPLGLSQSARRRLLPVLTALLAADLDLLLDPFGLDAGLWEWRAGGRYMPDLAGPNGRRGIPLANYAGWLLLTGGVTALYLRLGGDAPLVPSAGWPPGGRAAGRAAALLLLPYVLPAATWAVQGGHWRPLVYALPAGIALALALRG